MGYQELQMFCKLEHRPRYYILAIFEINKQIFFKYTMGTIYLPTTY